MLRNIRAKRVGAGRRLATFLAPFAVGLVLVSGARSQIPTAEQLQQLEQMQGGRGLGASGAAVPEGPSVMIQQPDLVPQSAPQPPSRLEQILSQRAGANLKLFGYDILGSGRPVTVSQAGGLQDDYVLGAGDEIIVTLRGQENSQVRTVVDRDGQVVLPRLAPISAAGRSFGSFREDVQAAVHRAYVATEASVTAGRLRQISVLVSGEVNNPGQRTLTGLSSVVDALLLSGGIRKTGSLRNVRVERRGHSFTVDLYGVLTTGGAGGAMRLADGDRILVPTLGRTIAVTGLVRRPGIFEMAPGQASMSLRSLMALAGGEEVRGRYRLSVLRTDAQGASAMMPLAGDNAPLHDSDIVFVQLGADQTTSQASLAGPTGLAGTYAVVSGSRLSDVIRAPGALGTSPYTPFGIIVRKDPLTLMPALLAFTPAAVLAGREDQTLQGNDVIRVLSTDEIQLLTFVAGSYLEGLANQQDAIRHPLAQKNDGQNSVANLVASRSGQSQQLSDVSTVPASAQREVINTLLNMPAPGSVLAQRQLEQAAAAQRAQAFAGTTGPQTFAASQVPGQTQSPLQPQGQAQGQPQQQGLGQGAGQGIPQAMPQMQFQQGNQQGYQQSYQQSYQQGYQPGMQGNGAFPSVQTPDMARNFSEEAVRSNRFASNREVETFGQLARQLNIDPLILINFLVDNRVRLDGAVRGPGFYFAGPSTSLAELVQAAGGTVGWADESGVELISTAVDRQAGRSVTQRATLPLRQGTLATYMVRPGDQLRFVQVFSDVGMGSVTVQGEVRFPGSFPITRGEHLSDLMTRAGGLTNVAYPYGTVFLRQSVAQMERESYTRAASEVQNQLIVAMTRVGNDKVDPQTFASMQAFVQELRNQQALGRISIIADPSALAANPAQDPLIEPGDVIYIPQRPSTISVLGQVLQPGSYPYKSGDSVKDYIRRAGGYASTADESETFVVLPDGSARRLEHGWLSFQPENLPPGSAIVIPRDVTPLDMRQTIIDVSQILSQLAVAIASVAVLSKQ